MKSEKTKIDEAVECIAESTMKQCKKIIELESEIKRISEDNIKSKSIIESYAAIIESLTRQNEKLRNAEQLSDKEEIQGLQKQIESYSEDIKKLKLQISSKNTQIIECEQRIEVLDNRNKKLSESMSNYKEIDKVFKSLNAKNKAYQNFIYEMMRIELKGDLENESEPETN